MGKGNSKVEVVYEKEDERPEYTHPLQFKQLIKKIDKLSEYEKNMNFYYINLNKELLHKISKKYLRFKGIERFCIPIIGVISSGKSTFMNYLLELNNILEMGEKVTTQFICIIRHDENATIPQIYETLIEKRDSDAFNFKEKGENLLNLSGNSNEVLKQKIKKRNENINKFRRNNFEQVEKFLDPEDYFLIIKTKIPLFENEYKDYGNLIDFLDIPGLDENGTSNFDNFIKPIFKNILFPIFIFDVNSYSDDTPKNLLNQFLDYYFKISKSKYIIEKEELFDNGFYILNKMDLIENDDPKEIEDNFISSFREIKKNSGHKIKIQIDKNNFIGISAKKLCETNQNSKLDNIIKTIIEEANKTTYNSFKRFIQRTLKDKYQIDIKEAENEDEDDNLKEKLILVNKLLKNDCEDKFNSEPKLQLREYTFIRNKLCKNETNPLQVENVKLMIQKSVKKFLDDFLSFNLNELVNKIQKEEENNLIKANSLQNNFNPQVFIDNFYQNVIHLFQENNVEIDKSYKKVNEIIKMVNCFEEFKQNNKIRILFLGKISSGKTSLLNSIIGYNLNVLPTTMKECTNNIFILKYSTKIKFYRTNLIQNENEFYFKEEKESLKELSEEEIKNQESIKSLKELIKKENDNNKFKYFSLHIPIEALENIENKEQIE